MKHKYQRYLKNYLIDRDFQLKFLLRFFFFTFLVLTIGGAAQYFISNRSILRELEKINLDTVERQKKVISFLTKYEHATNPAHAGLAPGLKLLMKRTFGGYNQFLKGEIRFMNTQLKHGRTILAENAKNLFSAFWGSLLFAGIIINIILALIYGLLLSHNIAGNHYRLKKFAKRLQKKDFADPLIIREKDFFRETAMEFDRVRVMVKDDLNTLSKEEKLKDHPILRAYKL